MVNLEISAPLDRVQIQRKTALFDFKHPVEEGFKNLLISASPGPYDQLVFNTELPESFTPLISKITGILSKWHDETAFHARSSNNISHRTESWIRGATRATIAELLCRGFVDSWHSSQTLSEGGIKMYKWYLASDSRLDVSPVYSGYVVKRNSLI